MIAADTNVLLRFITADHAEQSPRTLALFAAEEIWLPLTVVLETEWVLRSSQRMDPARISGALRAVTGLPNVKVENAARVARALDWLDAGMDFADALHLASAAECDAFATFDRKLIAAAERVGGGPPMRVP